MTTLEINHNIRLVEHIAKQYRAVTIGHPHLDVCLIPISREDAGALEKVIEIAKGVLLDA
jgi:hypothetical protein